MSKDVLATLNPEKPSEYEGLYVPEPAQFYVRRLESGLYIGNDSSYDERDAICLDHKQVRELLAVLLAYVPQDF